MTRFEDFTQDERTVLTSALQVSKNLTDAIQDSDQVLDVLTYWILINLLAEAERVPPHLPDVPFVVALVKQLQDGLECCTLVVPEDSEVVQLRQGHTDLWACGPCEATDRVTGDWYGEECTLIVTVIDGGQWVVWLIDGDGHSVSYEEIG